MRDRVVSPWTVDSDAGIGAAGSGAERGRARRILANAAAIREKFERNARGEVDAESEWAKLLGDVMEGD